MKNKRGMTYVELLVALVLLMVVTFCFTPILLTGYSNIQAGGEKTQDVYARSEGIEQQLATRTGDEKTIVQIMFNNLEGVCNVALNKAQDSASQLESLYGTGRVKVSILGGEKVYDNDSEIDFTIQMSNISASAAIKSLAPRPGEVGIAIEAPLGATKISTDSYTLTPNAEKNTVDVKLSDVDVTYSPLKITVKYYKYSTDAMPKTIVKYIEILPAKMMFVGGTGSNADYYTSAGITDKTFKVSARKMTGAPIGGSTLSSIQWVDNDNSVSGGYYAMAGANGTIRRLWNLTDANVNDAKYAALSNTLFGKEEVGNKTYYKNSWGGDFTDDYTYCSSGSDSNHHNVSTTNGYATTAVLNFNFNGYQEKYKYSMQNCRRISYILDYDSTASAAMSGYGFTTKNITVKAKTGWVYFNETWTVNVGADGKYYYYKDGEGWYTINDGAKLDTAVKITSSVGDVPYTVSHSKVIAPAVAGLSFAGSLKEADNVSGYNSKWTSTDYYDFTGSSTYSDCDLAYLKIKAYNNISKTTYKEDTTNVANTLKPNLTSLAYVNGKMLYLGTVPSYAYLTEQTGIGRCQNTGTHGSDDAGRTNTTGINILSNASGTMTSIHTYVSDESGWNTARTNVNSQVIPDSAASSNLNIYETNGKAHLTNTSFTLGYSSQRDLVFSGVAGESNYKSYENDYFASRYGTTTHEITSEDKKNIWFPGEYYNLTALDQDEDITVGVGYTVSGYSTQKSHLASCTDKVHYNGSDGLELFEYNKDSLTSSIWTRSSYFCAQNKKASVLPVCDNVSTSLETVTNDGVLAVQFGDDAFNTLYYKKDQTKKSVKFTAVDAYKSEAGYTIIFGDDSGSLYTANIQKNTTALTDANVTIIPTATTHLKHVKTVFSNSNYVLASGKSASGTQICVYDYTAKKPSWETVSIGNGQYIINDIEYSDGCYFAVGTSFYGTTGVIFCSKTPTVENSWIKLATDSEGNALMPLYGMAFQSQSQS